VFGPVDCSNEIKRVWFYFKLEETSPSRALSLLTLTCHLPHLILVIAAYTSNLQRQLLPLRCCCQPLFTILMRPCCIHINFEKFTCGWSPSTNITQPATMSIYLWPLFWMCFLYKDYDTTLLILDLLLSATWIVLSKSHIGSFIIHVMEHEL